jgi:hypothetical protein
MIYKITDRANEIADKIKQGYVKGLQMPFKCIDDLYSVKMGCVSYFVGHEYSGKTEFILERDVWLAKQFNQVSLIFTPETGDVDDIFLEICHKWCGKPLIGKHKISEAERLSVMQQVAQYFHVIQVDDELTFDALIEEYKIYESQNNIKINLITIDPFNELQWDLKGLPRDMWLENTLGKVRRTARNENIHFTIITHPIESDRLYSKEGYLLAPSRKQYAGGQAWARKGESMISIHRPHVGLSDEAVMIRENQMQFTMQKAKPKGIGQLGIADLYFDWKRSAYYEEINGKNYYAGEYYASLLTDPLKDTSNFDYSHLEDSPF